MEGNQDADVHMLMSARMRGSRCTPLTTNQECEFTMQAVPGGADTPMHNIGNVSPQYKASM